MENNEITIEQIKAFIEANKDRADVLEFVSSFRVEKDLTSDTVNAYLETSEGKLVLQPKLDRYATQAIKTHDEKQAPVLEAKIKAGINEGIKKLHPEETDSDRALREMREDMEKMKLENAAKELRSSILLEANKRSVPSELIDSIPYPSVEHFKAAATVIEKWQKDIEKKAIDTFVATTAYKPQGGKDEGKDKIDFNKLSDKEILKMEMEGTLDKALIN
jgi:hypothetical protein